MGIRGFFRYLQRKMEETKTKAKIVELKEISGADIYIDAASVLRSIIEDSLLQNGVLSFARKVKEAQTAGDAKTAQNIDAESTLVIARLWNALLPNYAVIHETVGAFVSLLQSVGARLHFYFDGSALDDAAKRKFKTRISRKVETLGLHKN